MTFATLINTNYILMYYMYQWNFNGTYVMICLWTVHLKMCVIMMITVLIMIDFTYILDKFIPKILCIDGLVLNKRTFKPGQSSEINLEIVNN